LRNPIDGPATVPPLVHGRVVVIWFSPRLWTATVAGRCTGKHAPLRFRDRHPEFPLLPLAKIAGYLPRKIASAGLDGRNMWRAWCATLRIAPSVGRAESRVL